MCTYGGAVVTTVVQLSMKFGGIAGSRLHARTAGSDTARAAATTAKAHHHRSQRARRATPASVPNVRRQWGYIGL